MSLEAITGTNATDVLATAVSNVDSTASASQATGTVANTDTTTAAAKTDDTAAVYDKRKLSEDDRKTIVAQLKADQEKRQAQLTELVSNMMSKQTNTFGQANDIWKFLAKGDFTVDAETKKKAQEAISEDGYWGVKQTSDRIVQFASALAGNDEKALDKMRDAFIKGYKQAEKTWGGKLPDISQRTYDAVLEKLDKLKSSAAEDASKKVTTTEDGTVVAKEN
ncbi:MAG: hypothetical protein NC337_03720 [Roseburia sp.]|nr:hypothetical protein [Roseburia sp.]